MDATRTRQVDRNGNVSYRVTTDGVHLGDVVKLASGKYRPGLATGDHGPDGTIKAGTEWIAAHAKPSLEAIEAALKDINWHLEVKIPADIHDARYVNRHARRLASLLTQQTEAQQTRDRLAALAADAVLDAVVDTIRDAAWNAGFVVNGQRKPEQGQ